MKIIHMKKILFTLACLTVTGLASAQTNVDVNPDGTVKQNPQRKTNMPQDVAQPKKEASGSAATNTTSAGQGNGEKSRMAITDKGAPAPKAKATATQQTKAAPAGTDQKAQPRQ